MVAKNHCLMKLRDAQGKYAVPLTDVMNPHEDDRELRLNLQQKDDTLELMHQGLDELNEEQRRCVSLFYLEKRSYQQVAEITGYSLLQVKSYIQNGKRNLKLILERKLKQKHA